MASERFVRVVSSRGFEAPALNADTLTHPDDSMSSQPDLAPLVGYRPPAYEGVGGSALLLSHRSPPQARGVLVDLV